VTAFFCFFVVQFGAGYTGCMFVRVSMQQFRAHSGSDYVLSPAVSVIMGKNASGKTTILEALHVAATGKSFRAADKELIQHLAPWARVDVELKEKKKRTIKYTIEKEKVDRSIEFSGKKKSRLLLSEQLPVVLFEPEQLRLLRGSPSLRRDYIDDLLSRTTAGYKSALQSYERTLLQRNMLLKSGAPSDEELFVWNIRISEYGARLRQARQAFFEAQQQTIRHTYEQIGGESKMLRLAVSEGAVTASQLLRELEKNIAIDKLKGYTSVGPHRDDLLVWFGDTPAEETASRGETRTLLLALKMVEAEILEALHKERPAILLDDVYSELDKERRKALTEHFEGYQTIITSTDAESDMGFGAQVHYIRL
jgi:DNA replication and repair protein RecF